MLDGSDLATLMANMEKAEQELDRLSQDLPLATKSQKFATGNEKSILAVYVVKHLKAGHKPALAETLALADPEFIAQREVLMSLWEDAERVVQRHKQAYNHWDTARSLLSAAKNQAPAAYSFTKSFPG